MMRRWLFVLVAAALTAQQVDDTFRFEVSSNLVLVHVTVKDRSGKPVTGLRKEDFRVYEDGQPQAISIFEFQQLSRERLPELPPEAAQPKLPASAAARQPEQAPTPKVSTKDRRLIVLYFDFAGMRPAEQVRARDAALEWIRTQMTASDLVSVVTFSSRLDKLVEFTDDRELLLSTISAFGVEMETDSAGAEASAGDETGEQEEEIEIGGEFLLDAAEFSMFDTDRKLSALEEASKELAELPEKKALVYFSGGVDRKGAENHAQLMATVAAAIRANVAFYPVDVRGLKAMPPGGDASTRASRGTHIYSGKEQQRAMAKLLAEQDTLHTLAADTGGKALLDNNDLAQGIRRAQQDIDSYYTLGYYSTNPAQDGRFRRITVKSTPQLKAKLEYRPGYYAPKLFRDFNPAEREKQLEEAFQSADPYTSLPVAGALHYFRLSKGRYFVPVALRVPASRVPVMQGAAKESRQPANSAELDFLGAVKDASGATVGSVRDTLTVQLSPAGNSHQLRKAIQYDTGFTLPPGRYRFKFLVRENTSGNIGTFETRFLVPDLDEADGLRLSSVVLSGQREPLQAAAATAGGAAHQKAMAFHPLVRDNAKLLPNVHHIFRSGQRMGVYFEVYSLNAPVRLGATACLIRDGRKLLESAPARIEANATQRRYPVEIAIPLNQVPPGEYICQVNVVDFAGRRFAFLRERVVVVGGA